MKTTTILDAWTAAVFDFQHGHGDEKTFRQCQTFGRALRLRIEAGDRAREALAVFANEDNWNEWQGIFEFDLGSLVGDPPRWISDNPYRIAQLALGIEP